LAFLGFSRFQMYYKVELTRMLAPAMKKKNSAKIVYSFQDNPGSSDALQFGLSASNESSFFGRLY